MSKIALVTYADAPNLTEDDQPLVTLLKSRQHLVETPVWNDPFVDWTRFDLIVVRSTWYYFKDFGAFMGWLTKLKTYRLNVWNSVSLIEWNVDKNYLFDLENAGVPIVPALLFRGMNELEAIKTQVAERGWKKLVAKPVISSSASATQVFRAADLSAQSRFFQIHAHRFPFLIQPFLHEIRIEGEWSLLYFNGEYSHAVLKKPKTNDFRVQMEHGGSTVAQTPPDFIRAAADKALTAAPEPTLYARVDGVVVNGEFQIMELELIEPFLFLDYEQNAANRFAETILSRL